MEIIAVICLAGAVLIVLGMFVHMMMDDEFWFGAFGFLLVIALATGLIVVAREDAKNPCIAWGTPYTQYVMVNNIMVPTTTTPCIRRQNETEK